MALRASYSSKLFQDIKSVFSPVPFPFCRLLSKLLTVWVRGHWLHFPDLSATLERSSQWRGTWCYWAGDGVQGIALYLQSPCVEDEKKNPSSIFNFENLDKSSAKKFLGHALVKTVLKTKLKETKGSILCCIILGVMTQKDVLQVVIKWFSTLHEQRVLLIVRDKGKTLSPKWYQDENGSLAGIL